MVTGPGGLAGDGQRVAQPVPGGGAGGAARAGVVAELAWLGGLNRRRTLAVR